MKKLNVGIIGLGRIASLYELDTKAKKFYPALTHVGSYIRHDNINLMCGADVDESKLDRFQKMWGIKTLYNDYFLMLREQNLDILSICTYPDRHYEVIKEASNYVKVIFCEKPFARSSKEIQDIIKIKNDKKVKIAINLYRQYDHSHNEIKNLIQSDTFGRVQRVNCYYGKGLRNMGTHLLGYILSIFGKPGKVVVLKKIQYDYLNEFSYDVYFEFNKHIPVFIQSCDFNKYRLFEIDFICEKGRIQILNEGLTIKIYKVIKNKAETGAYQLAERRSCLASTVGNSIYYAVEHLVQMCLDGNIEPIVSPEFYLELQLLIEEIEQKGSEL